MTDTKTCSRCKVEKPLTEFYKDRKSTLNSCKTCKKADTKVWRENNREKDRALCRERYATNIPNKLLQLIKNAVARATGKSLRKKVTLELLGCTLKEYIQYLESKFTEGMNWESHSNEGWHIDHIKPLRGKELTLEEKLERIHYTNTQPLWAQDNRAKGNKAQAVIEEK